MMEKGANMFPTNLLSTLRIMALHTTFLAFIYLNKMKLLKENIDIIETALSMMHEVEIPFFMDRSIS